MLSITISQYAWIIPICPCLAATILGSCLLFARTATRSQRLICATISTGMLIITMVLSVLIFFEQVESDCAHRELWSWITLGTLSLNIGYLVDPLSSVMLVLVTTVAVAVMVYTDGYMSHDQGYVRFFAYLSLFTASMLGLVLSPNLVQVYIFWELVGMCSYLLIGFWFTRASAAYACQKAFVTNRIGDFGLLLGILGFYWFTGSFEFDVIAERIHEILIQGTITSGSLTTSLVTKMPFQSMMLFPYWESSSWFWPEARVGIIICCILLFLGPIAKSAQFPLHVWLPDAMEGPTPISALIHAATMVAAGVFLTARLLVLFQEVPFVMDTVAWIGSITALLGATLALAQKDLKRGLAYSTMSQLGYMILALGIGSYQAGLFHLITHAYSKALLFLGSGSVIHGMEPVVGYHPNKNQDMTYMGGLRSYMPITGVTFLVGTLSLCGIPPFACFWSKDEILADAWLKLPIIGWIAWITAGLTAFYMFRMYFLTFEGEFRGSVSVFAVNQTSEQEAAQDNSNSPISGRAQLPTVVPSRPIEPTSQALTNDLLGQGKEIDGLLPIHIDDASYGNRPLTSNVDNVPTWTISHASEESGQTAEIRPHESSPAMIFPLMALAIPASLIGLIGAPLPKGLPNSSLFSSWLRLDTENTPMGLILSDETISNNWMEFATKAFPSVTIGVLGALFAWIIYGPHVKYAVASVPAEYQKEPQENDLLPLDPKVGPVLSGHSPLEQWKNTRNHIDPLPTGWVGSVVQSVYDWSLRRGYIDEIYSNTFVSATRQTAKIFSLFDQWTIDGAINLSGLLTLLGGESTRYGEGGRTTSYLFVVTAALFVLLIAIPLFFSGIDFRLILFGAV